MPDTTTKEIITLVIVGAIQLVATLAIVYAAFYFIKTSYLWVERRVLILALRIAHWDKYYSPGDTPKVADGMLKGMDD